MGLSLALSLSLTTLTLSTFATTLPTLHPDIRLVCYVFDFHISSAFSSQPARLSLSLGNCAARKFTRLQLSGAPPPLPVGQTPLRHLLLKVLRFSRPGQEGKRHTFSVCNQLGVGFSLNQIPMDPPRAFEGLKTEVVPVGEATTWLGVQL